MWEFLSKGGFLVYPILLGSVLALALFVERLLILRRNKIIPQRQLNQLIKLFYSKKWSEAKFVCQKEDSPLGRIVSGMLNAAENRLPLARVKEIAEELGERESFNLERKIGAIGVIASIEPLLGLLGTVLGMIDAFRQVEVGGVGDPRLVASGVWTALITTALGLAVAIPAFLAYRYLLNRAELLTLELQEACSSLLDVLITNVPLREDDPPFYKPECLEVKASAPAAGEVDSEATTSLSDRGK